MVTPHPNIQSRLDSLELHLRRENPVLVDVVQAFRAIDDVAYRMGLLAITESYATRISWWPLVSILGTFSAGKSSFVNHFLGQDLQRTGNQAVDDKFTVLCYSSEPQRRVLPGVALDADPRFPFYRISRDLDQVSPGEGRRVDAYLQLQTSDSPELRGKILIDSPGFDADAQRTSVLRMVNHIIDLSDLVLVFFDARHPEPGAMRDTLDHLVADVVARPDAGKFLYVLNQLDTTAREDNAEEVVAAWQRALAEKGLTTGRFYCIYNPDAAVAIEDEERRRRYEQKRDRDLGEIVQRIRDVEVGRAYRIVGALEKTAELVAGGVVPRLARALQRWRRLVLILDSVLVGVVLAGLLLVSLALGYWQDGGFAAPWWPAWRGSAWLGWTLAAAVVLAALWAHHRVRRLAARRVENGLRAETGDAARAGDLAAAFAHSTRPWRPMWLVRPAGWGVATERRLQQASAATSQFVQRLNDHFARPSGDPES